MVSVLFSSKIIITLYVLNMHTYITGDVFIGHGGIHNFRIDTKCDLEFKGIKIPRSASSHADKN